MKNDTQLSSIDKLKAKDLIPFASVLDHIKLKDIGFGHKCD
jgi:hypothetical protein